MYEVAEVTTVGKSNLKTLNSKEETALYSLLFLVANAEADEQRYDHDYEQ